MKKHRSGYEWCDYTIKQIAEYCKARDHYCFSETEITDKSCPFKEINCPMLFSDDPVGYANRKIYMDDEQHDKYFGATKRKI